MSFIENYFTQFFYFLINKNYKNAPVGLSGNDDAGQMSAWYIFSSLGFYPLTPTEGTYALGLPYFEEIELVLPKNISNYFDLDEDELPKGRLICHVSRHSCAVIDGVLNDTYDCSRMGTRCVYGYWIKR